MEHSLFLQFPQEIRLQIIGDFLDVDALRVGAWFKQSAFRICRQIREEAFAVAYGTRDLVFELPDFSPHRLDYFSQWPSLIQVHDQYSTFQQDVAPHFLRPGVRYRSHWESLNIGVGFFCPFHLFRAIHIEIPAPNPKDPAQLIMTWNRLRWISRLFEKASNGLPDIRLVFRESQDRSWFTAGRLNLSHPDLLVLGDDAVDQPSDLMLLLSAVVSMRQARSITVRVPRSAETNLPVRIILEWLKLSAIRDCKWGDYVSYGWDDWCYIEFLEHCELRFHHLLSTLQTSIAPFLRLEQLASLTHFAYHRMVDVSQGNPDFPSPDETHAIMMQPIYAAIELVPLWPPGLEACESCSDWETDDEDEELLLGCLGRREFKRWDELRRKRYQEILSRRHFLKAEREAPSVTSPSSNGIEKPLVLKAGSDPCLSKLEESAFESCDCYQRDRMWMRDFPDGVAPYDEVT